MVGLEISTVSIITSHRGGPSQYLVSVGKAPESEKEFIRNLYRLWFYSYGRGEARGSSSGFEHVFVGEIDSKNGETVAAGLHNWIQFYFRAPQDAP